MKNGIYLDNSSTSYPKAPGTGEAMKYFIEEIGCNIGRGSYQKAYEAGGFVLGTRRKLASLFGLRREKNVIFTPSVTYSLNYVLRGLLRPGDSVVISALEHNAVARPCEALKREGVAVREAPVDPATGRLDLSALERALVPGTRLCVINHASNVFGVLQDAAKIGEICSAKGIFFVLDAAQSAGAVPIDMERMKISGLCVTGHKGLLGPQGTGALLLTDELAEELVPTVLGGTGSRSDLLVMPEFLPDRFEPGTLNLPGIYGLDRALDFLIGTGIEAVREKEMSLARLFLKEIGEILCARPVGVGPEDERIAVVSLDFDGFDNAETSALLEGEYGVMTRCGLHCAPLAHRAMGTFPGGTVRFSFGYFNTEEDVTRAVGAIRDIVM